MKKIQLKLKDDNPGLVGAAKLASENVASTVKVSIPADERVVEAHRDAICKLTKGNEWVTCSESIVAEYLANGYVWDYQATAEARSMNLAIWKYWHDRQKERADEMSKQVLALRGLVSSLESNIVKYGDALRRIADPTSMWSEHASIASAALADGGRDEQR